MHIFPCLTIALALCAAGNAAAAPLRLCYEDVALSPWTAPDGSGLNFNVLRRVQERLAEQFDFVPLPWKRCLEEVRVGHMDGVFAAADTPERRLFSVAPTLPDGHADPRAALYSDTFNVYLRNGSGASWNGKDLLAPRGRVVVPRGYFLAGLLRERGVEVNEAVKTSEEGLRMLANGIADAAVLQGRDAEWLAANDPRFRGLISEAATPYVVMPLYLLIGRKAYDSDPKRALAIWEEIRAVLLTPEYKKLEADAMKRLSRE